MNHLGIEFDVKHLPPLDPGFIPLGRFFEGFLKSAKEPFHLAVERSNGQTAVYKTFIHGTARRRDADIYYVDRLLKTLLWMKGGFKIYLAGNKAVCSAIQKRYSASGERAFDFNYMADVFEHPFQVVRVDAVPKEKDSSMSIGRHLEGCRIGFDAGGSDRKVSAVIDGKSVFSEEVVWFPKTNSDPDYHYDGIVSALKAAAEHLPRVDAVGVSSAGVYINNRTMNASLFLQVPRPAFDAKVKDIYIRAITDTFGDVPFAVINDGDVTALAGAMSLNDNNVLGIAMGTSEAAGYVDRQGNITGWLNELAFVPVDASPAAMEDEWSGDIGVGCKYFSQDAVIKLAPAAGIQLEESLSPAEKLKVVQGLMEQGDPGAAKIYESIGVYLAHTLALYHTLYGYRYVLLLGRVMSGKGGELLLDACHHVLDDEYPALSAQIHIALPDEKFRRVGQSVAAASLPALKQSV
jgi:predicted NBD/HSP70 family sugar kinase